MNVDSVLVSDYACIEAGKLTVVGVFNRVPVAEAPVLVATMAVSVVIHGHASEAGTEHELEIRLLNARRESVIPPLAERFTFASADMSAPGIPLRHVNVSLILMARFDELGPYAFEVYIDGTYNAAASFYVGAPG